MRNISPSQLKEFITCKRKWWYKYVMGLGSKTSDAQSFGHIVHEFLELYHRGATLKDLMDEFFVSGATLDEETRTLIEHMITGYVQWDAKQVDDSVKIPRPEEDSLKGEEEMRSASFIHKGFMLVGRPDLMFFTPERRRVTIVEHKTAGTPYDLTAFHLSTQAKIYHLLACETYQVDEVRVMFNILYKDYPKEPKVNKDGSISKAKVVTTPELYRAVIRREGLNENDYLDILSSLPVYTFFERYSLNHSDFSLKAFSSMLEQMLSDVSYCSRNFPYQREGFWCRQCPYRAICIEGGDDLAKVIDFIKNSEWSRFLQGGEIVEKAQDLGSEDIDHGGAC